MCGKNFKTNSSPLSLVCGRERNYVMRRLHDTEHSPRKNFWFIQLVTHGKEQDEGAECENHIMICV